MKIDIGLFEGGGGIVADMRGAVLAEVVVVVVIAELRGGAVMNVVTVDVVKVGLTVVRVGKLGSLTDFVPGRGAVGGSPVMGG